MYHEDIAHRIQCVVLIDVLASIQCVVLIDVLVFVTESKISSEAGA